MGNPVRLKKELESSPGSDLSDGESIIFDQVLSWLKGYEAHDDLNPLKMGLRYSPKAVRSLIDLLSHDLVEMRDNLDGNIYSIPNRTFFAQNAGIFGLLNGFIDYEEYSVLARGEKIKGNFPESGEEIWSGLHPKFNNYLLPTIDQAAIRIDRFKNSDPKIKSIFFHGKWNTIPHLGHTLFLRRSLEQIHDVYQVDYKDMITVVACDTNQNIKDSGSKPFLTTAWRMSLMSYLPVVGYVCCSRNFDYQYADQYWEYKYTLLKPDFVPVEKGDPLTDSKIARARKIGAKIVELGTNLTGTDSQVRISSTGLVNGGIDNLNFETQYKDYLNEFGSNWRRDWFG